MVGEAISIQPGDVLKLRALDRMLRSGQAQLLGPNGEMAALPAPLYGLLQNLVSVLQEGRSLVVMPEEKQLTTQQAGELLGMSRPYIIRLLDAGEMPCILVGRHRRISLRDVLAYAKRRAEARRAALDRMARDAYEAGLYDSASIPAGGHDK